MVSPGFLAAVFSLTNSWDFAFDLTVGWFPDKENGIVFPSIDSLFSDCSKNFVFGFTRQAPLCLLDGLNLSIDYTHFSATKLLHLQKL